MQLHVRRLCWILFLHLVAIATQGTHAAVSTCNAEIRALSGTFTSPNYPEPPPKSRVVGPTFTGTTGYITCKWVIEVPQGKAIQLKFADFDMNARMDECDKGEVEVFAGKGKFKQSIDKYCSGNDPDSVLVTNNTSTVLFRRPPTFTGKGFLISFIAIDPGSPLLDDFVTCSATAQDGGLKQSFSVVCPSGCVGIPTHKVYGQEMYRDDSKLCLAAVHAGVISNLFGGRVNVKKGPHKVFFQMSIGNNVTAAVGGYTDVTFLLPAAEICSKEVDFSPSQLTASSFWNETRSRTEWLPGKAHFKRPGGWSPSNPMDMQWLQVDLLKTWNITGIVTLGSSLPHKWSTGYRIKYSHNGITFTYYKEEGQTTPKLFSGNVDHFTEVRNNFVRPRIYARYIRVYPVPVTDYKYRYALKIKVLGCPMKKGPAIVLPTPPAPTPAPTTTTTTTTSTLPSTLTKTPTPQTTSVKTTPTTVSTVTTSTEPPINKSTITTGRNRTHVTPVGNPKTPSQVPPVVPLDERSIIIIAIVAALAVTSILLAALVLILVRKRKKDPKVETMVPKLSIAQSNATYHAGIDSVRFPPYKKDDKKSRRKGKKDSQKFLFKNDNYTDSYPIVGAQEHVTVQNARGGVTLQRQLTQNGEIVTAPVVRSGSYATGEMPGPSSALLSPGGRMCSNDDTDSFQSEEDHEYQVIADPVTDFVTSSAARTSSKGSTASSQHSKKSDTMMWQQQQQQGSQVWGNGDVNSVFPPPHMTSFGAPQSQRSRSGTFPHQVHAAVGVDDGGLPAPPKTAPPQTSFTAPRFQHRKRGGSQSPPHAGFMTSGQRHSSSSGGSSQSPFDMATSQRTDHAEAPYYSSVPEYEGQTATPNGHLGAAHPHGMMAPKSENFHEGAWPPRKAPSYKTPRPPMFATLPSNGMESDVRHGGSDPGMTRHNGTDGGIMRSTSRSDSFAKQRSGYDQLYPQKYPSPTEGSKCMVAVTTMNNYNQLDLHTPV